METTTKLTSLAIDALTQFRAGVNKVKIGKIELTAEESFEYARRPFFYQIDEEKDLITAIKMIIISQMIDYNLKTDDLKKISVEVVQ